MFESGLKIGQILRNDDIVEIFKCGNMGGMRRSKATNTLVLISDYTKGIYHDKWIGGVLHYTGMGKKNDQNIEWAQNKTLATCAQNGVDVHLFEVLDAGKYIYCGRVALVDAPYIDVQPDEDGTERKVWIFPIRPIPDNDVEKPNMFVFKDMDDYKKHGKNVDAEYMKMLKKQKESRKRTVRETKSSDQPILHIPTQPAVIIPSDIVGKQLIHKVYGKGAVTGITGNFIIVDFSSAGVKKLSYEICTKNQLIDFI